MIPAMQTKRHGVKAAYGPEAASVSAPLQRRRRVLSQIQAGYHFGLWRADCPMISLRWAALPWLEATLQV
ncbi:hypothetical protein BP5796_04521 [Coleophoma crateriformis]|uniref:Uncharacterized protein n=1 Tax=Coleophoma crateriformis TaxID=565419 RepID=A0A3D8S9U6_9HELO|nr:hypothetical protein BP5796_04521 [Coleophoma crateriformis]